MKNRTKSYEMAETMHFGLIFMKIHEKIVRNGQNHAFRPLFHEIYEKIVRNRQNYAFQPHFHENFMKNRTKSYEMAKTMQFS